MDSLGGSAVSPEAPIEDRVREIENKLIQLETRAGLVRLSVPTLTLMWFAFLAALSAIIFIVRIDARLRSYIEADSMVSQKVDQHLNAPGHAISIERISELERRVSLIEQKEVK